MASLAIKHSWCVLFCTRIGHYTYIANYDIPREPIYHVRLFAARTVTRAVLRIAPFRTLIQTSNIGMIGASYATHRNF